MLNPKELDEIKKLGEKAKIDSQIFQEFAAFSLDAYNVASDNPPPGWTVFARSKPNNLDYFGKCYVKNFDPFSGPAGVVYAHRGTVPWPPNHDYITDFQLAREKIPDQFKLALQFVKDTEFALKQLHQHDDNKEHFIHTTIQTGHSLGAAIAQLVNLRADDFLDKHLSPVGISITFENPGIKPIVQNMIASGELSPNALEFAAASSRVLLADVDLINSCNEQIGFIFKMINLPYDYGVLNNTMAIIPADFKLNLNYAYYSFLDQHKIEKTNNYLLANGIIEFVTNPIGFVAGYVEFLDVSKRARYWQGYAETIWKNFPPDILEKYHDNFNEYLPEFLTYVQAQQKEAKSQLLTVETIVKDSELTRKVGIFKPSAKEKDPIQELMDEFVMLEESPQETSTP